MGWAMNYWLGSHPWPCFLNPNSSADLPYKWLQTYRAVQWIGIDWRPGGVYSFPGQRELYLVILSQFRDWDILCGASGWLIIMKHHGNGAFIAILGFNWIGSGIRGRGVGNRLRKTRLYGDSIAPINERPTIWNGYLDLLIQAFMCLLREDIQELHAVVGSIPHVK